MPEYLVDIPEKTYTRYSIEADTIEDALVMLESDPGQGEVVVSGDYYCDQLGPDEHAWYQVIDENLEYPFKKVGDEWVRASADDNGNIITEV